MSTGRIAYIDALKGFAIILVVFGHILQHYYDDENIIIRVVYSCHIPLFMFLSGYVSYKLSEWKKIKNRFYQLIIPFFSAILLGYSIKFFGNYSLSGLLHKIVEVLCQPDMGLWFLWALFFINILFLSARKLADKIKINQWLMIATFALILNGIELITQFKLFGFHWIAWYFIFFSFGAGLRIYMNQPRPTIDNALFYSTLILFPFCAYCFRLHNQGPLFYEWINLGGVFAVVYRLFVGILGTILFYELFKRYNVLSIKTLTRLGGGTLGIYYFHFYFVNALPDEMYDGYKPIFIAVASIAILFISYWLTSLCKYNKLTAFLVLGDNVFARKSRTEPQTEIEKQKFL